jgi:pimeloyl-ACP methyl ester carboxylesterase
MPPATALLLHGFTSGPASMWRFQEWLAGLGYQAEARAQLGHGGRGPAADYSLAALAADDLAMGDHDLVIGHSMGGATATLAAARRPQWAGRLVLVDPAWRFSTTEEAAAVKREELAALDRDAGEIRAAYSAWDERDGAAKIQGRYPSPTATPWRRRIRTCASCGSPGPATTRTATIRKPSSRPSSAGSQVGRRVLSSAL